MWFGLDRTNFSFVISFQRADWRVRDKQGYVLDGKLRQEAGKGIKKNQEGLQEEEGEGSCTSHAMESCVLPPDIDVRHLLSCHESIVL